MNNRTFLINLACVALVLFESIMIVRLWTAEDSDLNSLSKTNKKTERFQEKRIYHKKPSPISAYVDTTQRNLFASEREEYIAEVPDTEPVVEKEEKPAAEVVIPELDTDKITLYGVIVMEGFTKALVSDANSKSDRKSKWVKKDDDVSGFIVDSIDKDRLIVSNKGKRYAILLYDDKKPKNRAFVKKKTAAQAVKPVPKTSSVSKKNNKKKSDKDYVIISTPFGKFKTKKK